MPHSKAFSVAAAPPPNESSRAGAIAVAIFSTMVLAGAMAFAGVGTVARGAFTEPACRSIRSWLGIASSIELVSDANIVVATAAGARTAVTGRVLDADGRPMAGSAVRVRSDGRPDWDWVTSSGADGYFQVHGVAAGKVRIAAHDVDAGIVESPVLDASSARDVVLVLDRTVSVSGAVLDERGAPIARAAIKCAGKWGAPARVVIADDDGRFALRGAAGSVDRLTVWARGYEATTINVSALGSGEVQRDVRLHAARPLRGIVVDALGGAVAGARVSACPGKEAETALSDGAGAFELPATAVGCWAMASHPRFAGSRSVHVGDRRDIVLRLATGGAIEGTVVDERGKSVALFSVTIASFEAEEETAAGTATRSGETAEHLRGSFRVDDLPPGTYVLQVSAEGMVDTQSRPIQVGRGRVARGEQIVLTPAEVVSEGASAEEPAPSDGTASPEAANGSESGSEKGSDERPNGDGPSVPSENDAAGRGE